MTPGDFYKANITPVPPRFFNASMIGNYNLKDVLGGRFQPPTDEAIARAQLKVAKTLYRDTGDDKKLSDFFNNIISDETNLQYELETQQITALFEKWFLNNERIVNVGDKTQNMTTKRVNNASNLIKGFSADYETAKIEYKQVLNDLIKMMEIINNYESKYGATFLNSTDLLSAKDKIQTGIDNINLFLQTGTYPGMTDFASAKGALTIFGTQQFKSNINPNGKTGRSAVGQLSVISTALKGRINEIRAIEASQKLEISGLAIIDTAMWRFGETKKNAEIDIISGAKQNYADILIGSNNLTIECYIGDTHFQGTLKQLQDKLNQTKEKVMVYIGDTE